MATNTRRTIPPQLLENKHKQLAQSTAFSSQNSSPQLRPPINSHSSSMSKPSPSSNPASQRLVEPMRPAADSVRQKPEPRPGPSPGELLAMIIDNRVVDECLRAHNHYRAIHGVPELTHDPELSRSAQVCH